MRKKNIICFLLFLTLNSSLFTFLSFAQWVQQSVPVTSGQFFDMKFVNSNTGFIAHSTNVLLKTTDAGYNWVVNKNGRMSSISIVDSQYIYGAGYNNQFGKLYKTTNGGISWDSLLTSFGYSYWKTHFFNRDTGLISSGDGTDNHIWRTTDGGQTKQLVLTTGGANQGTFFFLKEKVNGEYYGWMYYDGGINYRTTNSGVNWTQMPPIPTFVGLKGFCYINKDTAFATINNTANYILYTSNGGVNWVEKYLSYSANCYDVFFINSLTGWIGVGLGNKIYATTNGGANWGTQYVNGSVATSSIYFIDYNIGWARSSSNTLVHTTNGGGIILSISNNSKSSINFTLKQNYPNPFNPSTNISYHIKNKVHVNIKIYNSIGKLAETLTNKNYMPGDYTLIWDASNYPSGVYFYKMFVSDNEKNQLYTETRKMIYLK